MRGLLIIGAVGVLAARVLVTWWRWARADDPGLPPAISPIEPLPASAHPVWRAIEAAVKRVQREAEKEFPGEVSGASCWRDGWRRTINCEATIGGQRRTATGVEFNAEGARTVSYKVRFDRRSGELTEVKRTPD